MGYVLVCGVDGFCLVFGQGLTLLCFVGFWSGLGKALQGVVMMVFCCLMLGAPPQEGSCPVSGTLVSFPGLRVFFSLVTLEGSPSEVPKRQGCVWRGCRSPSPESEAPRQLCLKPYLTGRPAVHGRCPRLLSCDMMRLRTPFYRLPARWCIYGVTCSW